MTSNPAKTIDTVISQIVRWAENQGASPERADNYGERAGSAFLEITKLASVFAEDFNKINTLKIIVSEEDVLDLVLLYNRQLMQFKNDHNISLNHRIDTHICAGIWYCCLVQAPIFGCADADDTIWDTADLVHLNRYSALVVNFAFYVAFRIFRGHYRKYQELDLLKMLKPVRKYLLDHNDAIAASHAAAVGIFLTISIFDDQLPAIANRP